MDPVTVTKIASTVIVFAITAVFGGIPVVIERFLSKSREQTASVISYLNCFAGGVFLGTAMLHLLAESEEQVKEVLDASNSTAAEYPITEVTISGGFFLILIVEIIVTRIMQQGHVESNVTDTNVIQFKNKSEHAQQQLHAPGVHDHGISEIIKENSSTLRAVILVLALSLHMIFEALAIGIQETEGQVWTLMLAVSLHKCIVAFGVGQETKQVIKSARKFIAFIVMFAIVASFGIPIGLVLTNSYDDDSLVVGILQSLATGTFFYVTFFEILQREFSHCANILKLFLCIIGYAAVALLKILDKD